MRFSKDGSREFKNYIMSDKPPDFNFLVTGIGSVPFQEVDATCREIMGDFPSMPFWPQFVQRSYLEDMSVQFSEGLPLIEVNEQKRSLFISSNNDRESELVNFYDHFLAKDIQHFSISRDYAAGLYELVEIVSNDISHGSSYIKGQTVGPLTFAAGIMDVNGNSILYNPELLEAMTNGLAIKALWQIRELEKSGKIVVIFLDEPYLSGYGSAFSSIERHQVINTLKAVTDYIRENSTALIGIHCCGNTDWSMIFEAHPDIISFDAFGYMEYFLLYSKDIVDFLNGAGTIAWGIIPTADFTGKDSEETLASKLDQGLRRVNEWGIPSNLLASRSILTPSCGMGSMKPEDARSAINLLNKLSYRYKS